ncbi:MAG: ribosome small subunit-dependent GTPase A, partial [Bacilli bacterium]|nr:ribosome small subunit-dependent GTPase A [Bacilli bacterium]
ILLKDYLKNKTAVFIGSSGVGKSTIINKIIGEEHFQTNDIRMGDDQGRHTTVSRELLRLENGGKVIDTPGIRIVSSYFVPENDFEDIMNLAEGCRFNDCRHEGEPGCMVQKAIQTGELDPGRFFQYQKAMKLNEHNRKRELERARIQSRNNQRRS